MAISTEISRLTTLRNSIRSKLISLGILSSSASTADLDDCNTALSSVTSLAATSYTPTTTAQTILSGQYLSGDQTIAAIPSEYIIPDGSVAITQNGMVMIAPYRVAEVSVVPTITDTTDSHGGTIRTINTNPFTPGQQ